MKSPHDPILLDGNAFMRDITKKIHASKKRIAIVVTTFHDDCEAMNTLIDALNHAADRGVKISICADAYTYVEPKEFLFRSPKKQPVRAYRAMRTERKLKSHGIKFHWLGRHSNITFAGRTHAKWMIVDEYVYSYGGINLDFASFENTDFLLRIRSQKVANLMYREHLRLLKADNGGHASRSHGVEISHSDTILVDGGLIGDSIIYRQAVRLAREASEIVVVSQYCPTGKFARILRRKHAKVYFNHWRQAQSINKGMIGLGMLMSRSSTEYTRDNYLHAKFVLFTMHDGRKVALTGSHNFMYSSVLVGTREVALQTENSAIIKSLELFLKNRVA